MNSFLAIGCSSSSKSTSLPIIRSLRFIVEFQWFFIALSVLPGSHLAIRAHLLPTLHSNYNYFLCASIIAISYSYVHRSFLMSGFRWLCHRSLHCLPILPGKFFAMKLQFFGPCSPTRRMTSSSSSRVFLLRQNYPWTFDELGVEDLLPAMEALDVSSLLEKSSNAFPISGTMFVDKLFEFFVFFLGPPSLLNVLIFFAIIWVDNLQFGDDVIEEIFTLIGGIRPFVRRFFCTFLLEMFDCAFENLFFEGFEAPRSLSQLFVIDGMIISEELCEVFQPVFFGQALQFLLSRQRVEGFQGRKQTGVDLHGNILLNTTN